MKTIRTKIFLVGLLTVLLAGSILYGRSEKKDCAQGSRNFGNGAVTLYHGHDRFTGCTIQSIPGHEITRANSGRARWYTFSEDGMLSVSVQTEDYSQFSRAVGWRQFHLLPRRSPRTGVRESQGTLEINLLSGQTAQLALQDGELIGLSGFVINRMPLQHIDLMDENKGGIEILPLSDNLLIDYGWRRGEIPIALLGRQATLTDSSGNKCSVPMNQLFRAVDQFNVMFLYDDDQTLYKFLGKQCPNVNVKIFHSRTESPIRLD